MSKLYTWKEFKDGYCIQLEFPSAKIFHTLEYPILGVLLWSSENGLESMTYK
jgi:hypothetical protein